MKIPDWASEAACRGMDPALFVPEVTLRNPDYSIPLAICAGCPAVDQCREHFIDERHGVFGGTRPAERERMRRERDQGAVA